MRADIHDGPEHNMLQPEAGYIDARPPPPARHNPLATHGGTIHVGQKAKLSGGVMSGFAPDSGHSSRRSIRVPRRPDHAASLRPSRERLMRVSDVPLPD